MTLCCIKLPNKRYLSKKKDVQLHVAFCHVIVDGREVKHMFNVFYFWPKVDKCQCLGSEFISIRIRIRIQVFLLTGFGSGSRIQSKRNLRKNAVFIIKKISEFFKYQVFIHSRNYTCQFYLTFLLSSIKIFTNCEY